MAAAKSGARAWFVVLVSCSGSQPPARAPVAASAPVKSAPNTPACIGDATTKLDLPFAARRDCTANNLACRGQCLDGDAGACMTRAYAIERDSQTEGEAALLFERACQLGLAIGCTNYAATIWAKGGTVRDLSCARRTFAKSCAAGEKFACGMVGRMLYEAAKTPDEYAAARASLEQSCAAFKGFPCRVLAKYFEDGKLGSYEPSRIPELLDRACAGGDPDACGSPATANETFH